MSEKNKFNFEKVLVITLLIITIIGLFMELIDSADFRWIIISVFAFHEIFSKETNTISEVIGGMR